jgi:hypothetical protein
MGFPTITRKIGCTPPPPGWWSDRDMEPPIAVPLPHFEPLGEKEPQLDPGWLDRVVSEAQQFLDNRET